MGVRIREDGRILCAAMHPEEINDVYLDDGVLYYLSTNGILVTEAMDEEKGHGGHASHGEWWFWWKAPQTAEIDRWQGRFVD